MLRTVTSVSLLALLVSLAMLPAAHANSGGPDFDPTDDFDSTADVDTLEGRVQTLVDLDELIPPEERETLDARREDYIKNLERIVHDAQRASQVDLRFRDTPVEKQFGGTCTAFGLLAAIENLLHGSINLSERHLWAQYRNYSSSRAIKQASQGPGIVESSWWPNSQKRPSEGFRDQTWYTLTQYETLEGDIAKVVLSLENGNPVYMAFSTPYDMVVNKPVYVDPGSGKYKKSGHAVSVVGYQLDPENSATAGGWLLLKNSWGTKAGDQGYQWYPFNLCTKRGMYCTFWSISGVGHD